MNIIRLFTAIFDVKVVTPATDKLFDNVVLPVTVIVLLNATFVDIVDIATVLLKVALPVTVIVLLKMALPITVIILLNVELPVIVIVLLNVALFVTTNVLAILTVLRVAVPVDTKFLLVIVFEDDIKSK